jgi:two-component SAPR family response regulator
MKNIQKSQASSAGVINILFIGENIDTRVVFKNAVSRVEKSCIIGDYYCLNKAVGNYDSLKVEKPDIIFLDIKKSTVDFNSEVRKIRNCDSLKDSSLIVFDSDSKLTDTNGIFSEGANAFINKPYDFQRLRKVIGNIVNENKFPKSAGYIIV